MRGWVSGRVIAGLTRNLILITGMLLRMRWRIKSARTERRGRLALRAGLIQQGKLQEDFNTPPTPSQEGRQVTIGHPFKGYQRSLFSGFSDESTFSGV
ncbi:hypothetical protein DW095_07335 [Bacteroides sp. AM07-16]|nr:hypothetical protein DW095_07335 [Bacteroides sp. AM07-16]